MRATCKRAGGIVLWLVLTCVVACDESRSGLLPRDTRPDGAAGGGGDRPNGGQGGGGTAGENGTGGVPAADATGGIAGTGGIGGAGGGGGGTRGGGGGGSPDACGDWARGLEPCAGTQPIDAYSGSIAALAHSADGRFIATLGARAVLAGNMKMWTASLKPLWDAEVEFGGGLPNAQSFAFSPDSTSVAVGRSELVVDPMSQRPTAHTWVQFLAAADGAERDRVSAPRPVTLAISPDGKLLAGGCQCSGGVSGAWLWGRDGAAEPPLGVKGDQAFAVAFSPDGALLAVRAAYPTDAGRPRTSVWRLSDRSLVWGQDTGMEQNSRLAYVAFSPDGTRVVSVSVTVPAVRIYRAADGTLEGEIPAEQPLMAVVAPGARDVVAAVERPGGLKLWRLQGSTPISTATMPGTFTAISFSPDGQRLVAGDAAGFVHQFCAR